MERNAQFTLELYVAADNKAIYVDSKTYQKASIALSFASLRDMIDHLRQLQKLAQVIVPKGSDLESLLGFQTQLKVRPNKLSQHERLARRLASLRTHVASKSFFAGVCKAEDGERYQESLSHARQLSEARLKVEIRQSEANWKRMSASLGRIAEEAQAERAAA